MCGSLRWVELFGSVPGEQHDLVGQWTMDDVVDWGGGGVDQMIVK